MNRLVVILIASIMQLTGPSRNGVAANDYSIAVADNYATQPAFNDLGEIVYVKFGDIISTSRGLLVTGVDASNIGISNSGEVVYAFGADVSVVASTTRGVLVSSHRSFGPTISSTTGEVGYIGLRNDGYYGFFTTSQGSVENLDRMLFYSPGVGDVNDAGEVVFELRRLTEDFSRVYSTTRGFISSPGEQAIQPAINDHGEAVWSGLDHTGRQQIFSSTRGQLTFFGGSPSFLTADLPDINNNGMVVFRGVTASDEAGLFVITTVIPEPASSVLAVCSMAIAYYIRKRRTIRRRVNR